MRRKSERNKAKAASPEKETERATRKSSRRRGRRAASESADSPKPVAINEEPELVASTASESKASVEAAKVTKDEEESVVWTVSREDASPGEIQKLKLSRQPNSGSEGSSEGGWSCRKLKKAAAEASKKQQGGKWRDSGVQEEADEQCRQATIGEATPSSSVPGQDSNEEVSDRKEILPETTTTTTCSADLLLSDDKPNIDDDVVVEEEEVEEEEDLVKGRGGGASPSSPAAVTRKREETTSSDEEEESSQDERMNSRRKKHRSKYNTEEDSDTNSESEAANEETATAGSEQRRKDSKEEDEEEEEEEEKEGIIEEEQTVNDDSEKENTATCLATQKTEEQKTEPQEEQKTQVDSEEKQEEEQHQQVTAEKSYCRPAKVNLKRSFSVRVQMEKIEEEASLDRDTSTANKENLDNGEDPRSVPRKRRWGTALSTDSAPSFSISTDSLKALVPGARPLSITEVRLSKDDDECRATEKWSGGEANEKSADESGKNGAAKKGEKLDNHIAARRKISIVKETASHAKSPSPPASKPTNILLIKNLVRPFTLNQIKELLSRTGSIVENGFWMDRIKSKCFVEYANEDQAFETRQALHGISWPISNPKRLHVEYATKDDMELALELSKDQSIPRKTEPLVPSESWQQDWNRDERTNTKQVLVVREWDLGKEDGQQHVKEKEKKEHDKKRRQRSRSPAVEPHLPAPARKFKKKEDEPPPAKLLDDLFRKTKATPCIYWLPLTNEQIVVKEEMRRQHMAEHARRLEEMRRAERNNRDGRRRRSPRK